MLMLKSQLVSLCLSSRPPALSPFEIHGFRVAVWASVVSSVIILLMSIAFITCCVVDCMNKHKKRRMERWVREAGDVLDETNVPLLCQKK